MHLLQRHFLQRSVTKLVKELENGGFVPQPPIASKNSDGFSLFKDHSDPYPLASCLIGTSHGLLGQHNLIGKGEADGKTYTREMSCRSVIGAHAHSKISLKTQKTSQSWKHLQASTVIYTPIPADLPRRASNMFSSN